MDYPKGTVIDPPALAISTIDAIRANRARLGDRVDTTTIRLLKDLALDAAVGPQREGDPNAAARPLPSRSHCNLACEATSIGAFEPTPWR